MRSYALSLIFCIQSLTLLCQTQYELNENARHNLMIAEQKMDSVLKQIKTEYISDTLFISNLNIAQSIWKQLRDQELKVKFPLQSQNEYGSMYPMCICIYLTQLTYERIDRLSIWVTGLEEGDVCAGSAKTGPTKE